MDPTGCQAVLVHMLTIHFCLLKGIEIKKKEKKKEGN